LAHAQSPQSRLPEAPAPVLRRLSIGGVSLLVLDEGHPGLLYGGNKVRKLRGILAHALSIGARDVLTFGAWGSHHVYGTAVWGARVGVRTHAVWIRQPETPHVRRMAEASHEVCASVHVAASLAELPLVTARVTARIVARTGRAPLRVPPGGSSRDGTRGWVALGAALPAAVHAHGEDAPEAIVVASGSGGTASGLLASGFRVCAVRVGPRALTNRARLRHLARRGGGEQLGELEVEHGFLAGGYGHVDERTRGAWELGREAGLPVETTYSAKALACALERARGGERVLYVQTASAVEPPPAPPLPGGLSDALALHGTSGRTARPDAAD